MDREKDIEEIVNILCEAHHKLDIDWTNHFIDGTKFPKPKREDQALAESIYNAGYRKQSEVAKEIIGEILLNHIPDIDGFFTMHESELAKIKKKYTEESENDR